MAIFKNLLFVILFSASSISFAGSNEHVMPKGTFAMLAPPGINKDYFLLEFGFVTEKEFKPWSYKYNAYVTGALFQDSYKRSDNLKAGGLGFKGGVLLPTQPWVPLLATVTVGFAKTVLHKNPIMGRDPSTVDKKDMFLLEGGLLYHFDQKYIIRSAYQVSNVRYIKTHFIIMLGVDY